MSPRKLGALRIIGGAWRSRLVAFDADEGVRPTPDRVRQTLFDWLSPRIEGARCLDLFAGSGALGLEALSRGAAHVRFVEAGRGQAQRIRDALGTFDVTARADIISSDAITLLGQRCDTPFDIVFLDPPYGSGLLARALPLLEPWLKTDSRVYLEWPGAARPDLPPGYECVREKKAGQVSFGLLTYTQEARA